jgi:hypothetical protein
MLMNKQKSYEYINDFLYFVLRPDSERKKSTLIYYSGINFSRFLPITKGRHRPMSNPAMRGLQLVNHGVRALVLSKKAIPKTLRGNDCAGIAPTNDNWYTECLLIENAPEKLPEDIINYCVLTLIKKFTRAILLDVKLPDKHLEPDELQVFLENLCSQYGK